MSTIEVTDWYQQVLTHARRRKPEPVSERTIECHHNLMDAIQAGRSDEAYQLVRDLRMHQWFDAQLTERHYIL